MGDGHGRPDALEVLAASGLGFSVGSGDDRVDLAPGALAALLHARGELHLIGERRGRGGLSTGVGCARAYSAVLECVRPYILY